MPERVMEKLNMICAYCENSTEKEGLSGMRYINNGVILPYILCADCCTQLTKPTVGSADSGKLREKFWEKVEKHLKQKSKKQDKKKEEMR